ncbi:MAG: hypothetical protein Q9201_004756 [Fulgogasparrea decipioides]
MSQLKTLHLAHVHNDYSVHVALFDHVKNAAFLQQQLLEGNSAFEYAFIDASVIISSTHLLAAVFRALNDWLSGRMKSKNVHSEIVFCLSMNNNISESFRRFGISPTTTSLLAIKVSTSPSAIVGIVQQHLSDSVEGTPLPFEDAEIARFTDIPKILKIYKLTDVAKDRSMGGDKRARAERGNDEHVLLPNGNEGEGAERNRLEMIVLGQMALRGAT